MFLYNEAPIQVWKSQYDSWAKSIGNFATFFVPCNLLRCGRIIEACRTGRQGPPGLEGKKEGGCLAAVLLNTNKFALVTKEQMSSLTHCVLLAHSTRSSAVLFPVAPASSGHTIYLNSPHSRKMYSLFSFFEFGLGCSDVALWWMSQFERFRIMQNKLFSGRNMFVCCSANQKWEKQILLTIGYNFWKSVLYDANISPRLITAHTNHLILFHHTDAQ